jgi:hypothetical protein
MGLITALPVAGYQITHFALTALTSVVALISVVPLKIRALVCTDRAVKAGTPR